MKTIDEDQLRKRIGILTFKRNVIKNKRKELDLEEIKVEGAIEEINIWLSESTQLAEPKKKTTKILVLEALEDGTNFNATEIKEIIEKNGWDTKAENPMSTLSPTLQDMKNKKLIISDEDYDYSITDLGKEELMKWKERG